MELTILPPASTALALLEDDLRAAADYLRAEKAEGTRAAYAADFRLFAAYCQDRGLTALPASPEAVMGFLSAQARGGAKASTSGRQVAAIRYAHRLAGLEPPTASEAVRATAGGSASIRPRSRRTASGRGS